MAFLTDEQRRNYGTFTQVPDDGQLAGYFLLDRDARRRAMACRGRTPEAETIASKRPPAMAPSTSRCGAWPSTSAWTASKRPAP